jgi:hypothetical protein
MNAGDQTEVRPARDTLCLEARQLEAGERLRLEADCAPLDQPTCPSTSTSGAWAGGRALQAKWQAAKWVGPGPASAGSSVEQIGSWAIGQRGWKRQPLGNWIGLGGSPTTAGAVVRRCGARRGTARSSPCV